MDLSIPLGSDFLKEIHGAIARSAAALVIIGPSWLVDHATGQRRLEKPEDYVLLEVTEALKKGGLVIPVLVGGATMPGRDDLPEQLKPLATLEALEISDQRWDYDTGRLVDRLAEVLGPAVPSGAEPGEKGIEPKPGPAWPGGGRRRLVIGAAGTAAVAAAVVIIVMLSGGGGGGASGDGSSGSPSATGTGGSTPIQLGDRVLAIGDQGGDVVQLQGRLLRLGFNAGETSGVFTEQTQRAVNAFKLCWGAGLQPDGRVDQATVDALQDPGITLGSNGDDTMEGTNGDDILFGLGGNDTIDGLGGNDKICGGEGNDTIHGGAGDDSLYGGAGNDMLFGDDGNDRLIGYHDSDALDGGPGTDTCVGDAKDPPAVNCEG